MIPTKILAVVALCALASCKGEEKSAASAAPPVKQEPAANTVAATPVAPAPPPPAAAPAPPPVAAGGHSAVPTMAEWAAVGEITVSGSSALACETKGVREWIRVSCRGDDADRGKPTQVVVERGGGAEIFTFASGGVSSLVYRFEEGTDVQALFSWEHAQHRLVSKWPRNSPKPMAFGQFTPAG